MLGVTGPIGLIHKPLSGVLQAFGKLNLRREPLQCSKVYALRQSAFASEHDS